MDNNAVEIHSLRETQNKVFEQKLKQTIARYNIQDNAFRHPTDLVINGAIRLLDGYKMDPLYVEDHERNMFALAIADEWLSSSKPSEKKPLIDILKVMACVSTDIGWQNLSGKVRDMSKKRGNPWTSI